MKYILWSLLAVITLASCGDKKDQQEVKRIDDLPFQSATSPKEYADIVLKAIRTSRAEPILTEYVDASGVNADSLDYIVSMYSSAIRGRDDWEFIDVVGDDNKDVASDAFDFAWLDQSDRLGMQIKIIPAGTNKGFKLDKIEFRSRLKVMESVAFPGGAISDYEKLEYDWSAKMKRSVEEKNK